MSKTRVLFVDRDGTLIEEPPDEQVDSIEKIRFMPGVFAALRQAQSAGFKLAMVTNQDGLGSETLSAGGLRRAAPVHDGCVQLAGHRVRRGVRLPAPQDRRLRLPQAEDRSWSRNTFATSTSPAARWSAIARPTWNSRATSAFAACWCAATATSGKPGRPILRELTERRATIRRKTKETDIHVTVNLDTTAPITISTGIGFFDHMLEQLAKHGGFSLELKCHGDLEIDEHHTVEDCALAVGEALREALGAKLGLARYGFVLPMDEAQVRVAIDLSGRAYGVFEGKFAREAVGGLPTELVPHFFKSLAESLKAAIHVTIVGENTHHMIEACFKGVGRALRMALRREGDELPIDQGRAVSARVAIIDSGGANIASLRAALSRLGADSVVTSDRGRHPARAARAAAGRGFGAQRHGAPARRGPRPADSRRSSSPC